MMHSGIELASSTSLITGDRLIIFPSVVSLRAHLQCLIALLRLKSALARHLELPVPEQSLFGEMCCSPEPVVQDEKEQVGGMTPARIESTCMTSLTSTTFVVGFFNCTSAASASPPAFPVSLSVPVKTPTRTTFPSSNRVASLGMKTFGSNLLQICGGLRKCVRNMVQKPHLQRPSSVTPRYCNTNLQPIGTFMTRTYNR